MPEPVLVADDIIRFSGLSRDRRNALADALRHQGGWTEIVPAAESLTLQFDIAAITPESALARCRDLGAQALGETPVSGPTIEIPVCYEASFAPDMGSVAAALGLNAGDVAERHVDQLHEVDFLGFTPGFAYLDSTACGLDVPRLSTPKARIAAGSVGVVGGRTGLYALEGPGGWPIIGRTPVQLFDPSAPRPAILQPGLRVRFVAIGADDFRARVS